MKPTPTDLVERLKARATDEIELLVQWETPEHEAMVKTWLSTLIVTAVEAARKGERERMVTELSSVFPVSSPMYASLSLVIYGRKALSTPKEPSEAGITKDNGRNHS